MATATVSVIGSFRQFYPQVALAVKEFRSLGITVRSPAVSRIINPGGDYARFETDSPGSPDESIQAATLEKILNSDLAYVVAPGGYLGRTSCYELGRIHERSIPVYFSAVPRDLPIRVPPGSVLSVRDLARTVLGAGPPAANRAGHARGHAGTSGHRARESCLVGGGRDERGEHATADRPAAGQHALADVAGGLARMHPE